MNETLKAIQKALAIYTWENINTIEKIERDKLTKAIEIYFTSGCVYYYF